MNRNHSLLRTVLATVITVWLSVTIAFILLRVLPGDAVEAGLIQGGASQERIVEIRGQLGLEASFFSQYLRYIVQFFRGDFGFSLVSGRPVVDLIAERFGATLLLASASAMTGVMIGVGSGIVASGDDAIARAAQLLISGALSMPVYWTGTLAILLFAVELNWLPAYAQDSAAGLILPAAVLGYHTSGSIGRVTQATVRTLRTAGFTVTARSKGLPESLVFRRHILRNALPPIIVTGALQFGFLLGGVAITEIIFLRTGLGTLLLDSVINQDYPVVQAVVALSATTYTVLLLLAEFANRMVDPRLRD